ncbi:hypothetical protein ASL14_13820 [Paenibacillus sp. IHB B 3084]|nr:hypothetical protein ASL14_13820 [Paenibacillus sp. IHB B 3084]
MIRKYIKKFENLWSKHILLIIPISFCYLIFMLNYNIGAKIVSLLASYILITAYFISTKAIKSYIAYVILTLILIPTLMYMVVSYFIIGLVTLSIISFWSFKK